MEALHLDIAPGRRYAVVHEPGEPPRALVVHVHAFADEMNKARRMVALQARALAAEGVAVLVPDLLGCGDSDGDFGDATWDAWRSDVVNACALARQMASERWPSRQGLPLSLWGLRAGCLLIADVMQHVGPLASLVFWQPALDGKQVLQQFLRLQSVGMLLGRGPRDAAKEAPVPARKQLAMGQHVEVAGYRLHPALAAGLESARLLPQPTQTAVYPIEAPPAQVHWLEISNQPQPEPNPAARAAQDAWRAAGHIMRHRRVPGPAFWQTTEIEEAPALIGATLGAIGRAGA